MKEKISWPVIIFLVLVILSITTISINAEEQKDNNIKTIAVSAAIGLDSIIEQTKGIQSKPKQRIEAIPEIELKPPKPPLTIRLRPVGIKLEPKVN